MILVCGGSFQAGLDESYWRFPRWRIWGVWVLFEYPISAHGWVFAIFGKTWSIHWAEYEFVGWFIQIPPYGQHLYLTPIRLPIMLVGGLALLPAVIVMIGRRVGFVDTNSKSNLVEAKCKPQWIRSPRLATVFATVTFMWSIYPSALFLFSWVCPWVERWPSETSLAMQNYSGSPQFRQLQCRHRWFPKSSSLSDVL